MISFRNDYSEGAHPSVLEAISEHNFETTCGYSMDPFCQQAADTVRALTACPDVGGRDRRDDGAYQRPRDRRN